jgi:hypothetical protein
MRLLCSIMFFTFIVSFANAQTKPDSMVVKAGKTINELNFPYKIGYKLTLKGTFEKFDKYNFPTETVVSDLYYSVTGIDEKNNIRFKLKEIKGKDTTVYNNTFLNFDKNGLFWWGNDDSTGWKDKHRTQAVSLPLYKGKKWKTYLNNKKVESECVATDSMLVTPAGTFSAFGTKYTLKVDENKNFTTYQEVEEFYNTEIGKIASSNRIYYILSKNGQTFNSIRETHLLSSYSK